MNSDTLGFFLFFSFPLHKPYKWLQGLGSALQEGLLNYPQILVDCERNVAAFTSCNFAVPRRYRRFIACETSSLFLWLSPRV